MLSEDELKADNEADTTDDVEVIAVRDASDEDVDMGRPAAWDRDETVSYQDAEFEDIDPEDTKTAPKATIVDPLFDEATSDLDEAEVAEAEDQKSWLMMLPFALLALIGLGMAILGVIDWLSLIRSETPVNENPALCRTVPHPDWRFWLHFRWLFPDPETVREIRLVPVAWSRVDCGSAMGSWRR